MLGARGERPVRFLTDAQPHQLEEVLSIPGVGWEIGAVTASWDAAWIVGAHFGVESPHAPITDPLKLSQIPGYERYVTLGLRDLLRSYQKEAVDFLARRAWAWLCLPCRTGKSLTALAADVLVDSRRTLISSPEGAKWPWAEEIQKRTGKAALILEGRGAREARRHCLPCDGRGVLLDGTSCEACKAHNGQSLGYIIYTVRRVDRPMYVKFDGVRVQHGYQCTQHPEVRGDDPSVLCAKCRDELREELRKSRYVVINYDLVIPQQDRSEAGKDRGTREDLPGWAEELRAVGFDVAICDEGHKLRGRPSPGRWGKSRRERVKHALAYVPRVWSLTATPIYGFTRDVWGQVDVVSNGLMGDGYKVFDARYCMGHYNAYGWQADGRSILADTELDKRLPYFMYRREKAEILDELPEMQHIPVYIEPKKDLPCPDLTEDKKAAIARAIKNTLPHKMDAVLENCLQEMAEGNKVYVLTHLVSSATRIFEALQKACTGKKSPHRVRMAEVKAQLWLAHGEISNGRQRFEMARDYREHGGAGAFISTIKAMAEGGISLRGASSIHLVELDWNPADIEQSTERPNEIGVRGMSLLIYIVKRSVDEHMLRTVLPKFDTQVKLTGDQEASKFLETLGGRSEETVDEIWARLTAHLEDEDDD